MRSNSLRPKVSVLLLTYNHERFIAQAIESALSQETSFNFEIVIGEDCSSDGTRQIVREFQLRHPETIRLLLPDQNLGMQRNYFKTLQACSGEYVSVLEGDDFWTSPHKLQQQADYLDAHRDCVSCFHNVMRFSEEGPEPSLLQCPADQKEIVTLEDLLAANLIPTCSTMFRNTGNNQMPEWLASVKFLDWALHLLAARGGNIGYVNETMAAYRIHSNGVYSSLPPIKDQMYRLEMFEALRGHLGSAHEEKLAKMIFFLRYNLAIAFTQNSENEAKFMKLCLKERPLSRHLAQKIRLVLRFKAPKLFSAARRLWVRREVVVESDG